MAPQRKRSTKAENRLEYGVVDDAARQRMRQYLLSRINVPCRLVVVGIQPLPSLAAGLEP